jgi:hypothetical protein
MKQFFIVKEILLWSAAILNLILFIFYNTDIFNGDAISNIVPWGLWAGMTVLNFSSYKKMGGSWAETGMSMAGALGCITTFLFVLGTEHYAEITITDLVIGFIGAGAIIAWKVVGAKTANIIVQLALALSFIPLFISMATGATSEPAHMWLLWAFAFFIHANVIVANMFLKNQWHKWEKLAYPANCMIMHFIAGMLAL